MKNKFLLLILSSILLSSCSDIYRKFEKVEDMKWYKSDAKKFTVDIKENGNYDLIFAFRYATMYPYKSIKVLFTKKTPDSEEFTKDAEFIVVDENNKYLGEPGGDIWDLENPFAENEFMEKGIYEFTIENNMNADPVIVVMEIGLIVRKSKK
jgi:gliding motility-associated lipoprotein GldH